MTRRAPAAPGFRWPAGDVAALAQEAGLAEAGRMPREPCEQERFRRRHLLPRRQQASSKILRPECCGAAPGRTPDCTAPAATASSSMTTPAARQEP